MSDPGRDEFDAALRAREARWEALPDREKESLRARFDRDNPRPIGAHAGLWELTRRRGLLDLMESSGPIILVGPPSAPPPIREPPAGDPPDRPADDERRAFLDGLADDERSRLDGCSPGRLDEIVMMSRIKVLGGDPVGRKLALIPGPEPAGRCP